MEIIVTVYTMFVADGANPAGVDFHVYHLFGLTLFGPLFGFSPQR
jgi:hypothetical protein